MLITSVGVVMADEVQKAVEEYIIFYGSANDSIINKLKNYKLIIIEPRNFSKAQLAEIKKSGTIIYGYTSFVEQNENNIEFKILKDKWFYKPDGQKIRNEQWGSYYMDLSQKGYQNFLIEQVYLHVIEKGCDGLFIDTIGDIDDMSWSSEDKKKMQKGYRSTLSRITKSYPNLKVIQNWGFNTLKNYSYDLVDGVMWEGFSFDYLIDDQWSINRFNEIEKLELDFYIVTTKDTVASSKGKFNGNLYLFSWETDVYD